MSVSAADLLSQTENAISGLLVALANVNVEEYEMSDGRRVRRADFPRTLTALRLARAELAREAASGSRHRFTLAKLGRASGTLR